MTMTRLRLAFYRWLIPDRPFPTREEVAIAYWEDQFQQLGTKPKSYLTLEERHGVVVYRG